MWFPNSLNALTVTSECSMASSPATDIISNQEELIMPKCCFLFPDGCVDILCGCSCHVFKTVLTNTLSPFRADRKCQCCSIISVVSYFHLLLLSKGPSHIFLSLIVCPHLIQGFFFLLTLTLCSVLSYSCQMPSFSCPYFIL